LERIISIISMKKKLDILLEKRYMLIYIIAMFPVLRENIVSTCIIILSLLSIIYNVKNKISPNYKILFLSIPFFVLLLSFFISDNKEVGSKIIIHSLSFLIFPLIFSCNHGYINKKFINQTLLFFASSVFLLCIFYIVYFSINFNLKNLFAFTNQSYSTMFRDKIYDIPYFNIHPTYISNFIVFSLFICLEQVLKKKYAFLLLMPIYIILLILFNAKISILLFIFCFVFWILNSKLKTSYKLIFISIFITFTIFLYQTKYIQNKIDEYKTFGKIMPIGKAYTSLTVRNAIQACNVELIQKNWKTGVGIGEVQANLNKCYQENFNSDFYKNYTYNTHNYYFFILIAVGIFGFLFFFTPYLFLFYKFILSKESILIIFMVITFITCITENFLYRHHGIIFFNLFCFIFYYSLITKQKKI